MRGAVGDTLPMNCASSPSSPFGSTSIVSPDCLLGSAGHVERQRVALQPGAYRLLVDLAGRAERNAIDEQHVVGHPPTRDLAIEIGLEIIGRGLRTGLEFAQQERALVPFGMRAADPRGVCHGFLPPCHILHPHHPYPPPPPITP